jgi:26S proteasome regulatory subunit N3
VIPDKILTVILTRRPRLDFQLVLIMTDVEMKSEDAKPKDEKKEKDKEEATPPPPSPVAEIKSNIALIERAVSTSETPFTHCILRSFTTLRKRTDEKVLREVIDEIYPKGTVRSPNSDPIAIH